MLDHASQDAVSDPVGAEPELLEILQEFKSRFPEVIARSEVGWREVSVLVHRQERYYRKLASFVSKHAPGARKIRMENRSENNVPFL